MSSIQTIGIVGAGAWGTALSCAFARAGRSVILLARSEQAAKTIDTQRKNETYLPGITLHASIKVSARLEDLKKCDAILLAVPSQQVRAACTAMRDAGLTDKPLILTAKGIELQTGLLMPDIAREFFSAAPLGLLSGPNFAAEVASELPTATTLAATDETFGRAMIAAIGSASFRPYLSADLRGVALAGAVKNVLAIASGVVIGRGLGENARASVITRGIKELSLLTEKLGANPQTLMGLSGIGDVMLTCYGERSRNFRFGKLLGEGKKPGEAEKTVAATIEGIANARSTAELARQKSLDMPICFAVEAILSGRVSIDEVMQALLQRPFRTE